MAASNINLDAAIRARFSGSEVLPSIVGTEGLNDMGTGFFKVGAKDFEA
jgi:hypothetical protein